MSDEILEIRGEMAALQNMITALLASHPNRKTLEKALRDQADRPLPDNLQGAYRDGYEGALNSVLRPLEKHP